MTRITSLLIPIFLLLTLTSPSLAADDTPAPTIYTDTKGGYKYHGCYNETTGIAGTTGARALYDGKNEVKRGEMTVQMCQSFCKEGATPYKYAGLEFATECWCAQQLSGISTKLDDKECNLPCDGDKSQACGGALKLTVYIAGASSRTVNAVWVAGLVGGVAFALI